MKIVDSISNIYFSANQKRLSTNVVRYIFTFCVFSRKLWKLTKKFAAIRKKNSERNLDIFK